MNKFIRKNDTQKKEKPPLSPEDKHKRMISLVAIAVFIVFFALIAWFVGRPLIQFVEEPERFRAWVNERGLLGRLAFIGMVALQVIVAIIPGEPLEIGAGYAFGAWQGLLLCLIGMAIGSAAIYFIVKKWGLKVIEAFFPVEKIRSLRFMQNEKRLNLIVFILFLIPGTPKDLLTYCVWLSPMKFSTYIVISSIARIPSVVSSTIAGGAVGDQNYQMAIIVFAITAVISVAGILIYRRILKSHERQDAESREKNPS